jgi:hypothetical protein
LDFVLAANAVPFFGGRFALEEFFATETYPVYGFPSAFRSDFLVNVLFNRSNSDLIGRTVVPFFTRARKVTLRAALESFRCCFLLLCNFKNIVWVLFSGGGCMVFLVALLTLAGNDEADGLRLVLSDEVPVGELAISVFDEPVMFEYFC